MNLYPFIRPAPTRPLAATILFPVCELVFLFLLSARFMFSIRETLQNLSLSDFSHLAYALEVLPCCSK